MVERCTDCGKPLDAGIEVWLVSDVPRIVVCGQWCMHRPEWAPWRKAAAERSTGRVEDLRHLWPSHFRHTIAIAKMQADRLKPRQISGRNMVPADIHTRYIERWQQEDKALLQQQIDDHAAALEAEAYDRERAATRAAQQRQTRRWVIGLIAWTLLCGAAGVAWRTGAFW